MTAGKSVTEDTDWPAFAYYRLSDADEHGGVQESNSITNQRRIVENYVLSHPQIRLIREWIDDGRSGVYFDRPAFMKMMEALRQGEARCILVKDLSRFGRDYIEVGNYVEQIFPMMKVRFIAVNDEYDSECAGDQDRLLFPFRNIMNDAYSRDASVKVRSSLRVKRQRGEFVNAFTRYGYMRAPKERSCVIPDPAAARVIRFIFNCRLEGMSPGRIAALLNGLGIDSPLEHKKRCGERLETSFLRNNRARWGAQAVLRILQDETCLGVLTLGRTTTPNHKIRRRMAAQEPDMVRHENRLQPLIGEADFRVVERMLAMDTRVRCDKTVRALSGIVFCGACGHPVTGKRVGEGRKRHCILICSSNRRYPGSCPGCTIREERVEAAWRELLAFLILYLMGPGQLRELSESGMQRHSCDPQTDTDCPWDEGRQDGEEENRYRTMLTALYEDYCRRVLTEEEYEELYISYTACMQERRRENENRRQIQKEISQKRAGRQLWNRQMREGIVPREMTSNLLIRLIDRIDVLGEREISISLMFGNGSRQADGERRDGT